MLLWLYYYIATVIMVILLHCDGYIITCVIMAVLLYRYVAIIDLCSKLKITLYRDLATIVQYSRVNYRKPRVI